MLTIGIYVYDHAEVLDFSGPFEVFSTASRVGQLPRDHDDNESKKEEDPMFRVILISELGGIVTARGGFRVVSDYNIQNHPCLDVLIVVGGIHSGEMKKQPVLDWIASQAAGCRCSHNKTTITTSTTKSQQKNHPRNNNNNNNVLLVASVCTGAFLLAAAGVITNESVTTHWDDIPTLQTLYPSLQVCENIRWIDEGHIVTSAGISAGIDMSLYLVSRFQTIELAQKTARQMEFDWTLVSK